MVNVARLVGPSVAGIVIAASSEGWCFLIDGISYVAVIISLLRMRLGAARAKAPARTSAVAQFKEGFAYAFGFAPIRSIILLLALVSLVGVPYSVLMPVFATQIFHGGPHTLGFLMTASGCGALLGALWLAARKSVVGLGRVISMATAVFGFGLISFSFMQTLPLALGCLTIAGFGFMVQMASSNTVIQTIVEDEKRGRVMSFYTMAFLGTVPLGSLIAGWLSSRIGAPHTLALGGVCCIIGGALFARVLPILRTQVRPIYVKLGILTAAELSVPPERN
jgi:MFS family permease